MATERERINNMTDEEFAAWIADHPKVTKFDPLNPLHVEWLNFLRKDVHK